MNIAFLALGTDLASMSSRTLSAYARSLGHKSRILFIPSELSLRAYSQATLEGVTDLIKDCDLVGITVFTSQYRLSAQITEHIKSTTRIPVLWGGIHAMIRPDECLQHADGICMGEGESFLEELMSGKPFEQITGLWYRANGDQVANGKSSMVKDINTLPFQDFSFTEHYFVDPVTNRLGEMDRKEYISRTNRTYTDLQGRYCVYYKTMASRGCPYSCGYCNNSVMHNLYTNRHFRRRTVVRFLEELETVCHANPFIELIHIADDTFLNRSVQEIQEFSKAYRERVGLPIRSLTTPTGITNEKIEALLDAGLCHLYMGIESGSTKGLERYHRRIPLARTLKSAQILNRYRARMLTPKYDIICKDPLATPEEMRENVTYLTHIPRPRFFQFYTMGLFHGTRQRSLVEQAGLPTDDKRIYDNNFSFGIDPDSLYDMLLLCLNLKYMPDALTRFLAKEWIYRVSCRTSLVNKGVLRIYRFMREIETKDYNYGSLLWYVHQFKHAMTTGDWGRFRRFLGRVVGLQKAGAP